MKNMVTDPGIFASPDMAVSLIACWIGHDGME